MARHLISIFLLLVLLTAIPFGQPSVMVFDFSQNNSTYTWNNNLSKNFEFKRLRCDLNITTNSLLLKRPSKRWQEQLAATFNANYRLGDGFSLAPHISHSRSALQDRIVYTSEVKLAIPVRRLSFADFTPFVANRAIKRVGDEPTGVDRGTGYGIAIVGEPINFLNNNIESMISYEYYDLNRIPFSEFKAGLNGDLTFREADSVGWRLASIENTTRYYARSTIGDSGDSAMVVRQLKVDRRAEGVAKVNMPGDVIARINADISFLSYYYGRTSQVVSLTQANNYTEGRNYEVNFEKNFIKRFRLLFGYKYNWGQQDFRGEVLDQLTKLGEFSFNFVGEITDNDTVSFDGIMGVTSYYGLRSPSQNERDVQTQIYNAKYRHRFSPYFAGEIRGAFSNFHQIYISGLNSANNNENKTYLLQAAFDWLPFTGIKLDQTFEIQANYIMYDYVPNLIDTPNRIFRRGASETRFTFKLRDNLDIVPGYIYRYEDYGKLIYQEDNWQMATGWDRRYHALDLKLGYRPVPKFYLEPQYAWELKREYNHVLATPESPLENDAILREERLYDTKQIAGLKAVWTMGESEYLDFSYSRREWDVRGRNRDISEFVNVSVRYMF
jgi:hypothetical protein